MTRKTTCLVLALSILASLAGAQERVYFKPSEFLERYEELQESEYAELYDFARFEDRRGMLEQLEIDALVEDWKAHVASIDERIRALKADPREKWLYDLDRELEEHSYLGNIAYRRLDHGPFAVYVQNPLKPMERYHESVAEFYGKWLVELEALFRDEYVEPLGLERRAEQPAFVLIVLTTKGMYTDYADAVGSRGLYASRAHYDPTLRIAVTYQSLFDGGDRNEERQAALHEMVHALRHAYTKGEGNPRGRMWFDEGLADYLAAHRGTTPGALREHAIDERAVQFVTGLSHANPSVGLALMPPLAELVATGDYQESTEQLARRCVDMVGVAPEAELVMQMLYVQSSLWMHYLHQGENGKYRERIGRFAGSALAGDDGPDAFRRAFEGVDLAALDRGFREHVNAAAKRMRLRYRVPAFPKASDGSAGLGAPSSTTGPLDAPSASVELTAEALGVAVTDPATRFALALGMASEGRYSAAAKEIRALVDAGGGASARWRSELERLDAAIDLRRRFLEHLSSISKKLKLEDEGGRLLAHVESVDDEYVRLGSNRYGPDRKGIDRLALDDIDALQLAELMHDRSYDFDPGWMSAYPLALAGDAQAAEILREARGTEGAEALLLDAREDYPARLKEGRAIAALNELAALVPPATPDAARAAFQGVSELVRGFADVDVVAEREPVLRRLAQTALEMTFDDLDLSEFVRVPVEERSGGRVRLVYEFDEPAELDDFSSSDQVGKLLSRYDVTALEAPSIAKGYLYGGASHGLDHVLQFEDEVRVTCRLRFVTPQGAYDPSRWLFHLGICAEGGGYAFTNASGSIVVYDPTGHQRINETTYRVTLDQQYDLEVALKDGTVSSSIDGRALGTAPAGPRTSGGVFLMASAGFAFELYRLEIEGKVSKGGLEALRDEWIESQLADAGL